jgi:hypothetical protein
MDDFLEEPNLTTEILEKMTKQCESETPEVKAKFQNDPEAYADFGFYFYLENGKLPDIGTIPNENIQP